MVALAQRTKRIDSSGIRKVFALAAEMKDPVNLSIGQPHFDVPEAVKQRAIEAIQQGRNAYTLTAGIPELREKIQQDLKQKGIEGGEVMISAGVSGGIILSFLALLDEGDEIIVPDPYFVMYKHLTRFVGAQPVYVDTYPDFLLDPEKLEAAVTPKTKAVLVNSPGNPTGVVYDQTHLQAIVEVADRHGLILISDEIYDAFLYEGEHRSPAALYPNTLVLNGFSKSAAMTGWRLGYIYGPSELIAAMLNIQMYSFVCAPSMAQYAGLEAMDIDFTPYRDDYRRKRDALYQGIKDLYSIVCPGGAFYMFPQAPNRDGDEFVKRAIQENLLIVPGSVFSERSTHFRISFAAEDRTIERGIEILRKLAK